MKITRIDDQLIDQLFADYKSTYGGVRNDFFARLLSRQNMKFRSTGRFDKQLLEAAITVSMHFISIKRRATSTCISSNGPRTRHCSKTVTDA